MKPLVIIPARGGSKGVPGKNIKDLGGKPLIAYTVEAAREIFDDSYICVSTDDDKIKRTVEALGLKVPFMRPDYLATDTAGTREVVLHALEFHEKQGYKPDTVILLQPTSPFRHAKHLKQALLDYSEEMEMLVSVKEAKSNPYYTLFEESEEGFLIKSKNGKFSRRQDCPKVWELNGAIYIFKSNLLYDRGLGDLTVVKKFVMDEFSSLDIDTTLDWQIAECLMAKTKE